MMPPNIGKIQRHYLVLGPHTESSLSCSILSVPVLHPSSVGSDYNAHTPNASPAPSLSHFFTSSLSSLHRPPAKGVMGMEGETLSGLGNGGQMDGKAMQTFQSSFVQVQNIFDQNRLLINEINQNHESKTPNNLTRNVGLIRELNNNIRRVADLYGDLSVTFAGSMETSSEAGSSGTRGRSGGKRIRSG